MKTLIAATTLMLAASLAACSEDKPAVCSSVDNLKASTEQVKKVDVTSSGGLTDLQTALKAVQGDLATVKADAKTKFSAPLDAVEKSFATLKASIQSAKTDTSAATIATAGSALSSFRTDVQTLIRDVQSTC
jgi:hypothetical protein